MNYFKIPLSILSERNAFFEEVSRGENIKHKIISQLICIFIFFGIYGFIIGISNSLSQSISSAMKLPLLFIITLIVCFPTLYIFNILLGSRQTFGQHFAIILSVLSVTSVLLLSFSPIALFFLLTTKHYQFVKLLNVAIFGITGIVGVTFFYQGMNLISDNYAEGKGLRGKFLILWILLYAFVGSQLAWTLRPFFGAPHLPFELFRDFQGNFYLDIIRAISEILGVY